MKHLAVILLAFASLCFVSSPKAICSGTNEPLNSQKASICAAYNQMNAAFVANQISDLMLSLTGNYVQTDPKGQVLDREATRKKLQSMRSQMKTVAVNYAITGLTVEPQGILTEMHMHTAGTGEKRILFVKMHGTFTNEMVVRDLWIDTPSGWRIAVRKTLVDDTHLSPA